eukprot:GGOE01001475.1.p1 GENE.GGOE01001475.1~~GGOE01001475.1.p1  ORF type:complete len:292 (+),score=50.88 GGOE01001475.1:16-891(+)
MTTPNSFEYVCIPAQDKPLFKCTALVGVGDLLPTILKPAFADGLIIDEVVAQAHAIANLGPKKAQLLDLKALQCATASGSVETFALVRPSHGNKMCGVYLYMDEVGALKKLPINQRAVQLASTCGFDKCSFHGDVYVGRVRKDPAPAQNVDFLVQDLNSSSEWLKRAAAENIEYNMELSRLKAAMEEKGLKADDKEGNLQGSDRQGGYSWLQSDDQVEVVIDIPSEVVKGDIRVKFSTSLVSVIVRGEERLWLPLFDKVEADECTWTIAKGKLTLTMEKATAVPWAHVTKG